MSALHDAARGDDAEKVADVLAQGLIDVNTPDRHSRTPLHLAAWAGKADAVEILLAAGADVKAAAVDDTTALHFAAQKGHTDAAKLLLGKGANPTSKTRKGMNALHFAAQNGNAELVKLLLKKKSNPTATNKAGKTAAELAKNKDVQQLLADAVAARQSQSKSESAEPGAASARPPDGQAEAGIGPVGPPGAHDAETSGPAAGAADAPAGGSRKRNTRQQMHGDGDAIEHVDSEGDPLVGPAIRPAPGPSQQLGSPADHKSGGGEPAAKKQKPAAPTLSHLGDEEDD